MTQRNMLLAALAVLFLLAFLVAPVTADEMTDNLGDDGTETQPQKESQPDTGSESGGWDPLPPPLPKTDTEPDHYNAVVVKPDESAVKYGDKFKIQVEFEPEKGVHIYVDNERLKFVFDELEMVGAKYLEIEYPKDRVELYYGEEGIEGKFSVNIVFVITAKAGDPVKISGDLKYEGCAEICYDPKETSISFDFTALEGSGNPERHKPAESGTMIKDEETEQVEKALEEGLIIFLLVCFGFGILASLSPCVYPLIPITAGMVRSFGSTSRVGAFFSSLVYVSGFIIVYSALGVAASLGGDAIKTALETDVAYGIMAAVMVALALSMFGLFEIKLPNSIMSKAQQAGSKTGKNPVGLFIMGMLGACMVGPCLGPALAGLLTVVAREGSMLFGLMSMGVFAVGMSILLVVVGTFNAVLPRSGVWMTKVNISFGFILLGVAAYFGSNIYGDAIYYLALGVLLVTYSVFLGCWDALTKDSGVGARILRAVGILLIAAGVVFGASGAMEIFDVKFEGTSSGLSPELQALYAKQFLDGDEAAIEKARQSGRPVVVDFYGNSCPYCERNDRVVFSDPKIIKALERFETIKINIDEVDLDEKGEYDKEVDGPPTIMFYDSNGTYRGKVTGPQEVEKFLERLAEIK